MVKLNSIRILLKKEAFSKNFKYVCNTKPINGIFTY